MITGVFSFLGGTAFRWLFGSILDQWNKYQDHKHEVALLTIQHAQDADKHLWQQEAIAAQAAAGVKVIEAQTVAASTAATEAAFNLAMQGINEASKRNDWIGAWNAGIRPFLATVAILLLAGESIAPGFIKLTPLFADVACAALGVFVGERIKAKGA